MSDPKVRPQMQLIIMAGFLIYFVTGKLKIRKTKPVVIKNIEELETA